MKFFKALLVCLIMSYSSYGQQPVKWGDQHNGSYANPILPGDYQNTDIIRVGSTYYYISATKELSPGMMILSSMDMVNWKAIGHAVNDLTQIDLRYNYNRMEGNSRGIWAVAIRYHDHQFYVYFTDPDFGVFMTTASKAGGPWAPLTKIIGAAGWDDPCPFWDDNGQAYLVATNFADNYKIHLFKMSTDGKALLKDTDQVIHQSKGSEANKLYKINNYYYHFYSEVTPEGRMPFMARSRLIAGPYNERRQLIHKADREPNQGGLVQTDKGDWYFVTHHGKAGWEGREASLLPVTWTPDGWPVWGNVGADGIGNMVWSAYKPTGTNVSASFQTTDDFNNKNLSPQWEWYFQPRDLKWSLMERPGYLRLYACKPLQAGKITKIQNILTQRPLRLEHSTVTVKIDVSHMEDGQVAALCLFGKTYGAIGIMQTGRLKRFYFNDTGVQLNGPEVSQNDAWLRSTWDAAGKAHFYYSTDNVSYQPLGGEFTITNFGNYIGAKIGLYTVNDSAQKGYVDVDWFKYDMQ
jgi:beta-xylosidase